MYLDKLWHTKDNILFGTPHILKIYIFIVDLLEAEAGHPAGHEAGAACTLGPGQQGAQVGLPRDTLLLDSAHRILPTWISTKKLRGKKILLLKNNFKNILRHICIS